MGLLFILFGVVGLPLITALATWGVVKLARRPWTTTEERVKNVLGIIALCSVGLAATAGMGCTAFVLIGLS